MRCLAGCILDLKASETIFTLNHQHLVVASMEEPTENVSPLMYSRPWLCGERVCESR